jgi:UDP-glucose 4-epimerase
MSASRPTAIVTGASGFIGRHIANLLADSDYAVLRLGGGSGSDELTLPRLAALHSSPELIVHCAGGSSVGPSVSNPLGDFTKTVPPTAHLLEYVRTVCPSARLVLLSSAAVYGNAIELPIRESAPLAPVSPYGFHKEMCEDLCRSYGRNFGVRTAIVRLFSVYGSGLTKQLLWDACEKARAGRHGFSGTGYELRDWLHVSDACTLIHAAAKVASIYAPVFNGGAGEGVPVAQIVGQIFRGLNASRQPEFDGVSRAGDPVNFVADVTCAHALGWQPRVALTEGVDAYIKWYQERI